MTELEKMENRNRIVSVWKADVKDTIGYCCYNEDGTPVEDSWYHDQGRGEFRKVKMTYEELCHDLGFDPDVRFVDVAKSGAITYTIGKPWEINALYQAINARGYRAKASKR